MKEVKIIAGLVHERKKQDNEGSPTISPTAIYAPGMARARHLTELVNGASTADHSGYNLFDRPDGKSWDKESIKSET